MITDRISYIITRIKNAVTIKHEILIFSFTKISLSIFRIFKKEGFIKDFKISPNNKKLIILLKYEKISNKPMFKKIKQISKPSLRTYMSSNKLSKLLDHNGITLLSTSKGILTNKRAKELHLGGEILCYIW
uniref:Ribosomal protein S8 n=1 Tax=Nitzschia sp. PL1-4 TaxID=2083272 RepID=A0A2Z5ZB24_9STRA|nr:ribosomal protein S8 [Nitzschia sp. PL1-4]